MHTFPAKLLSRSRVILGFITLGLSLAILGSGVTAVRFSAMEIQAHNTFICVSSLVGQKEGNTSILLYGMDVTPTSHNWCCTSIISKELHIKVRRHENLQVPFFWRMHSSCFFRILCSLPKTSNNLPIVTTQL